MFYNYKASLSALHLILPVPAEALLFDCDGVILESEALHLKAYNLGFNKFNLKLPGLCTGIDKADDGEGAKQPRAARLTLV